MLLAVLSSLTAIGASIVVNGATDSVLPSRRRRAAEAARSAATVAGSAG